MIDTLKILTKNVRVKPRMPVTLNKDLKIVREMEKPMEMTIGNIQRCMLLGATVFEVLEDGTEIMLYSNNYNTDNSKQQKSKKDAEIKPDDGKGGSQVNGTPVKPVEPKQPVTPPADKAGTTPDPKQATTPLVDNKTNTTTTTDGKADASKTDTTTTTQTTDKK